MPTTITAAQSRAALSALAIRCDGESDAYVAERFRQEFLRLDQLPSESMAEGIPFSELEDICAGRKTTWSDGNPITEAQQKAACAAMNA